MQPSNCYEAKSPRWAEGFCFIGELFEIRLIDRQWNGEAGATGGARGNFIFVEGDDKIAVGIKVKVLIRVNGLEVPRVKF